MIGPACRSKAEFSVTGRTVLEAAENHRGQLRDRERLVLARLFDSGLQHDLKTARKVVAPAAGVQFGEQSAKRRIDPRCRLETAPGHDQIRQMMHPLARKLLGRKVQVLDQTPAVGSSQGAERFTHQIRVSRKARAARFQHSIALAAGKIKPDVAVVVRSESESGSVRPVSAGSK